MYETAINSSLLSMGQTEFRLLRDLVHRHTGIWLRENKQVMLASRLTRRLREHGISSFADYYNFVESQGQSGPELTELINCVTTNKTSFFREHHHFDFLTGTVVDEIISDAHTGRDPLGSTQSKSLIRVWSAACSTGEEPYSIAIALLEKQSAPNRDPRRAWSFHVVASDIDTNVLSSARSGVYRADVLEDIEPLSRPKYFLRGKDDMSGYVRVKKQLTEAVQFERINLIDRVWPLTGTFDVVFFRNALIYFQQETQDLILRRIIRYIKPGGYLFLGHSEHVPWLNDLLEPKMNTVYQVRKARL